MAKNKVDPKREQLLRLIDVANQEHQDCQKAAELAITKIRNARSNLIEYDHAELQKLPEVIVNCNAPAPGYKKGYRNTTEIWHIKRRTDASLWLERVGMSEARFKRDQRDPDAFSYRLDRAVYSTTNLNITIKEKA